MADTKTPARISCFFANIKWPITKQPAIYDIVTTLIKYPVKSYDAL